MTLSAFPYFGGKYQMVKKLLPLFPPHYHYVEPFGGSAVLLLNKPRSAIETYNDLDSSVVTFFRVLRDQRDDLIEQIWLTPHAREEYELSQQPDEHMPDVERARRFYVRMRQGFHASPRSGASKGWRSETKARSDVKEQRYWENAQKNLRAIAERFRGVQIENKPAFEVLTRRDTPESFTLLDPPYVPETTGHQPLFNHNLTNADHEALAKMLQQLKGKVMLCGYRSALYDYLFADWLRLDFPVQLRGSKQAKTESVWLNYEPQKETLHATTLPQ